MAGTPRKSASHVFEVLVSFSALNKGDRFTTDDEGYTAWAMGHVETGYLREVSEGVAGVGRDVGQGDSVSAGDQESSAR